MISYDPNNIFARILRGELPCHRIHEDEHTLAFLDIMPQSEGHTLVLPKAPAVTLLDLPADALSEAMQVTQRLAGVIVRTLGADGFKIAQFNGEAAGQTVFHVHFHIIPRWAGVSAKSHAQHKADQEALAALAVRLRAALDA